MRLFSAPGSTLSQKRAWLMTTPFDRELNEAETNDAGPVFRRGADSLARVFRRPAAAVGRVFRWGGPR